MSESIAGLDLQVYLARRAKSRILTAGASASALLALVSLSVLVILAPSSDVMSWSGLSMSIGFGAFIAVAGVVFPLLRHLRRPRPAISEGGIVPSRWLVIDLIRRRRVIPWQEIKRIQVAHGRSWSVYVTLNDGTVRFVWKERGMP